MATEDSTTPPVNAGLANGLLDEWERRQPAITAQRHSAIDALVTNWLEAHEHDLAQLVRPHVEWHAENGAYPDSIRDLFGVLARPEHQTQFFTALFALQGIINAFVQAAIAPFVQDVSSEAWKVHPHLPLSPDQAADAVLKGWRDRASMTDEASLSGIDATRFTTMVDLAGEPPGIMAMLDLWRRGLIDTAELDHAIVESRIRPEWIDAVHLMATNAPSTAAVIAGYVEGHLSEGDARERWKHAGGRDEDFDWEYQTAGHPPGAIEMLHLLNRGLVTHDEVVTAIRESDIKNKYIAAVMELRRYLPPPRSIVAMVRQGAIDDAHATQLLQENGVTDADAADFIKSAHHTRASAHKELSAGKVLTGYTEHTLTRSQASQLLTTIGYDSTQAGQLLDINDAAIVHHEQQTMISHAHTLYTTYRIDKSQASSTLDASGIDASQRDKLLGLWGVERTENKPRLTHTQVTGAWRRSLVDTEWAMAQLTGLGYTAPEAFLLLAESIPPSKFPIPKLPPKPA